MAHQYKRRTMDEAVELAKAALQAEAPLHLTSDELVEMRVHGTQTGGTPTPGWSKHVGFTPTEKDYYEVELYKPSATCPYVSKRYVCMLVPRNRNLAAVHFIWKPSVEPYAGPHFE